MLTATGSLPILLFTGMHELTVEPPIDSGTNETKCTRGWVVVVARNVMPKRRPRKHPATHEIRRTETKGNKAVPDFGSWEQKTEQKEKTNMAARCARSPLGRRANVYFPDTNERK